MSFMHFDAVSAAAVPAEVVNLSGGSVFAIGTSSATAGWLFSSTGTVFSNSNGFLTQHQAATDWIIPNGSASVDYEIRAHRTTGISVVVGPALDAWHTLDLTRQWTMTCLAFCIQFNSFIIDIRWQDGTDPRNNALSLFDSAPVITSAVHTVEIDAEGFF